jgi:hypothetical protein
MAYVHPSTSPEDMSKSRAWTGGWLSDPAHLPVSFVYDGKAITGIPDDWNPVMKRTRIEANIIQIAFEGTHAPTGLNLKVECLEYLDFPVVEWTAWLANGSDRPTPLISDFLALDGAFAGRNPILVHCNGDYYSEEDIPLRKPACKLARPYPSPRAEAARAMEPSLTTASCSRAAD